MFVVLIINAIVAIKPELNGKVQVVSDISRCLRFDGCAPSESLAQIVYEVIFSNLV